MQYRTLGKTGLNISRLGFGGIPIQRIDAEGTRVLIHQLKDAGVNYIDTARSYTTSEEYLGYALEGIREHFVLATKSTSRTRDAMAADIRISLKNLRTNYIDLYQVHNPSPEQLEQVVAPGGALEALLEAKAAKKVGHLGVTAHSLETFRMALEMDWVETIMFPYNIVESQGTELIHACGEKGIGFVCMKPLAGGAIEDGGAGKVPGGAGCPGHPVLPPVQLLPALHRGHQHLQRVPVPGIPAAVRSGGLGQGAVSRIGEESLGLCGMRRLRGPLPLQPAHPGNAEGSRQGLWGVKNTKTAAGWQRFSFSFLCRRTAQKVLGNVGCAGQESRTNEQFAAHWLQALPARRRFAAFSSRWEENQSVAAVQPAASSSPPDCCIQMVRISSDHAKSHPPRLGWMAFW